MVAAGDGVMDGAVESIGIDEGAVGEIMLLEVAPASLDVVQFGGVCRQPLEGQPGALGQRSGGQPAAVDRSIVENRDQRSVSFGSAVSGTEAIEQRDKVGGALAGAGMYEKVAMHRIEGSEHRLLPRLAGRLDAQFGTPPGPAARPIGMRERLGFVEEHQIDRARPGLGFQIDETLAAGRNRRFVLAPFEGVARPPEGKPLCRSRCDSQSWCDSQAGEIAGPPRRAISAHRRPSVQPPSWRVSSFRIAVAIAPACGPISACRPGALRRRSAATPPCAK
jgi:hypothetical protein